MCHAQHLGLYLEGQVHSMTLKQNSVRPITLLFEVRFRICCTEMITIVRGCVARNIWVLPRRSRSQHDLEAKSCPAHNFVFRSRISKLLHRNDHHSARMCRAQHLGLFLEGQGHSMTLKQNRVRPITLLFEVRFRINFTEMITILKRRVACNIWAATLKVKVTAWPCSKTVSGP